MAKKRFSDFATDIEAITGDGGDFMELEWCINLNF